jgi:drug/metabolite transporter (DMT)-like permease
MTIVAAKTRIIPKRTRSRSVALIFILAGAAFIAVGAVFDLITDAQGKLPSDHEATFRALTGLTWLQATNAAHAVTPYVLRAEAGYAAYELLFGVLFLIVAAIPLRRGEPWAWWCSWLLVAAFVAFACIYGAFNSADRGLSIAAAILVSVALIVLAPIGWSARSSE